jgi:hypothetical protein
MAAWVVGFLLFRDDTWAAAAPPGQAGPGHLPYPLISIVVGAAIGVAVSSRAGLGPRQRRLMPLVGMVLTPFLPLLVIYALFFAGVWTLN